MTDLDQPSQADEQTSAALKPPWTEICPVDRVPFDRGVAALVDGEAVAIFRLSPITDAAAESSRESSGEWYAVSHVDPATGSPVMARGLVGSSGAPPIVIPTVASPLHKHRYNLRTGSCLDDPTLHLDVFEVDVTNGMVRVRHCATAFEAPNRS